MKRIFALVSAMLLAVCFMTACGKDLKSSKGSDSKISDSDLLKTAEKLVAAAEDRDVDTYLKVMFPDKVCDLLGKVGAEGFITDSFGDISDEKVKVKKVEKTEEVSADDIDKMEKLYSMFYNLFSVLADKDITMEKLMSGDVDMDDLEEFKELYDSFSDMDELLEQDVKSSVDIVSAVKVVYIFERDGEEENADFIAYKVKGEELKLDMVYSAMLSYAEKSKQSSLNSAASSISKAYLSAATDLECEGIDTRGGYIFSSDSSKEVLASTKKNSLGKEKDRLLENVKLYYDKIDSYEYFVVIKNCSTAYVVVEDDKGNVGTYPPNSVISGDGDSNFEYEKITASEESLDSLYKTCKNIVKK